MSKRQWMVLLMLFLTYLLLGASIFYHIESQLEIDKAVEARKERIEINALLHEHYMPTEALEQHEILARLTRYCGKSVYNYTENETDTLKWDFYNSFYFAYTVVSTIGYGNLAPTNMLSRVLMIFYAVVGIPMNGILLAQLGEFFGLVFVRAHKKYKSYKQHHQTEYAKKLTSLETRKAGLAVQILMYLIPGFVMFIFFPAFLFSHYEGWSYDEAVYYAFVTLTTIGFGDYVAGQDNTKGSGVLFILYKSFLIAWISFGLGYIVMIMTFIATGMRSKKIVRLERKLAMNLKHTQSKIWNEFNKEVGYLRRVFNELQLSKVKPIYVDEDDYEAPPPKFQRSNSFPDLRDLVYGGMANPLPPHPRRRANSEVVPVEPPLARVVSETDLQRIDKNATFATHAMVQPAELLARLVNILGYIPPSADDANDVEPGEQSPEADSPGVQGFNDKEILSSEKGWNNSTWKLGGDSKGSSLRKPRSRATSEVRLDPKYDPAMAQRNVEWTWSGPSASTKIQEIIKARRNGANGSAPISGKETKSRFANFGLPISVPKTLLPRWIKQFSKREPCAPRSRSSLSVDDMEVRDSETYLTQPSGGSNISPGHPGGFSKAYDPADSSSSRPYFTHTGAADLASSLEGSNLLEETSLADFLRALTALHTRVAGPVTEEYTKKPQRKMGTACLTPPKLPSLLALFSPMSESVSANQSNQNTVTGATNGNSAARRFSLRPAEHSGSSTPSYNRRSSLAHPYVKPRRRFSLRPVVTPLNNSPQNGSPYLSGMNPKERQGGSISSTPAAYNAEAFVVDCPKESLVQMEGAPGVSSPVTSSTGVRRFSLRPTVQGDAFQPSAAGSTVTKGLPRWRAGMLQRQINQINMRKRVRAFSLSDVNTEASRSPGERSAQVVSPLVDGVRILGGPKDLTSKSGQKTVTIVSPRAEDQDVPKSNESVQTSIARSPELSRVEPAERKSSRTTIPMLRAISASDNPFAFVDEAKPNVPTNPFVAASNDHGDSRTIYQALRSVRNIETEPSISRRDGAAAKVTSLSTADPTKKESISSCSTATTDTKSNASRKVSPISVSAWSESRKYSDVSQRSSSDSDDSRKSSTNRNPRDKPRVSIDSYKPLMEVKIEKPSEDPFERYRATMRLSMGDGDALAEVKVDRSDTRPDLKSRQDNRESNI